jgi:Zn-dependent protease
MFSDTPIFEFRGPFGVPVQIGGSLIFLVFLFLPIGSDPAGLPYDIAVLLILILSIFLHELGHAWGTKVQGLGVHRIMLYGGGGFCEHQAATPAESELIVAMGPIVNLALWALCSLAAPYVLAANFAWLLETAAQINLVLACLSMLPVMPLDGGKLFQLALMRLLPEKPAVRISGAVGLVFALAWVPAMIACLYFFGFMLLFLPPVAMHWEMLRHAR